MPGVMNMPQFGGVPPARIYVLARPHNDSGARRELVYMQVVPNRTLVRLHSHIPGFGVV
jgi:hypothetical protein